MEHFAIPEFEKLSPDSLSSYIKASAAAFSDITGIPVTFFNSNNDVIFELAHENKICSLLGIYSKKTGQCRKLLSFAGKFSSELGEPYIFLCKAGLTNVCVPLIIEGSYSGYFIAGPFIMEKLRGSIIANFPKLNNLGESETSAVNDFAFRLPVFDHNHVIKLSLLFYNSILSAISFPTDYLSLKKNISEQITVSDKIRKNKKNNIMDGFPIELHKTLLEYIEQGDTANAVKTVDEIQERFSIISFGNLENMKTMTLWTSAMISKFLSDNTKNNSVSLDVDLDVINRITDSDSFDELLDVSRSIVSDVSDNMLASIYPGSSALISQAVKYIRNHFSENISLNSLCSILHVNSSYFSTLFKQEMNCTFTEYLTELRIEKACKLLLDTNLRIVDVASESGFEDQSYFNKVFKKTKKVTPREYREKNK